MQIRDLEKKSYTLEQMQENMENSKPCAAKHTCSYFSQGFLSYTEPFPADSNTKLDSGVG